MTISPAISKAVPLGIQNFPSRSTLSYANKHRPSTFFQDVSSRLAAGCQQEASGRGERTFRFRHRLVSIDSSVITLYLGLFTRIQYTRTKGGAKLLLMRDHVGY